MLGISKIHWIHNSGPRPSAGFLWDILDELKQVDGLDISLQHIPVVRSWRQLWQSFSGFAEQKSHQRIIHAQYGSLVGLQAVLRSGESRIVSLRGSDIYQHGTGLTMRLSSMARVFMSYLASLRADKTIVMSRAMQRKVQAWPFMSKKTVHVLCDAAGVEFWQGYRPITLPALCQKSFTLFTISLSSNNPVKRTYLVEEAISLCKSVGMNVSVKSISGVGRDEVARQLLTVDAVVLPSRHEGFPNAIKEALLLGRPFIATDVSDLAQFTGVGQGGLIVDATALDIAFGVIDLIGASALELPAKDRTLAQFHPAVCALKHILLYRAVDKHDRLS